MKLARCSVDGFECWAVLDPIVGRAEILHGDLAEWAGPLVESGFRELPRTGQMVRLSEIDLLAPLSVGASVFGVGATYAKHITELGLVMPERPAAFLKTRRSIVGPSDPIAYPALTNALDYEAELVVVVAKPFAAADDAMGSILGYCIGNEVSARDLQFAGGVTGMDMFSAKALDATAPVGPWIVTRDEIGARHPDLDVILKVDDEIRQHDRTSSMVWGVDFLLAYVNDRARVDAGDLLFTGTMAGVGHEDGRYLEPGQVVKVVIERLGTITNTVGPRP